MDDEEPKFKWSNYKRWSWIHEILGLITFSVLLYYLFDLTIRNHPQLLQIWGIVWLLCGFYIFYDFTRIGEDQKKEDSP